MNKEELRKIYAQKRKELNNPEALSQAIFKNLSESFSLKNKTIHIFLSIIEKNEIHTLPFIKNNLSSQFVTSISDFKNHTMKHFHIDESTSYSKGKFNIPEPIEAKPFKKEHIDIILIPMFISDKSGHRVGYGKGFYDRFLKENPKSIKIGLNFFEPLDYSIPTNLHDIPLDYLVCPNKVFAY